MNLTKTLYVCSTCGSPSVEYSALVGGTASCKACGWKGAREELAGVPVRQGGLMDEEKSFLAMYNDFRKLFSENGKGFVQFLVKWGFVAATQSGGRITITVPEHVVRYVNGIFFGAFKSVLEVRQKLEEERVRGTRKEH